jgi:CRP-like cAMP-binding protein
MDRLEELRAAWQKASAKDNAQDAVKVLVELEKLEPHEPRWSQRLGEAYRRTEQTKEAVEAFARAFQRYFDRGFLPRAIAMAKLVKSLDAARGDLLEASLPKGGPGVPPPLPFGRPVGKPPPLPARAAPTGPSTSSSEREGAAPAGAKPKAVVRPPPLPAGDGPKPARSSSREMPAPQIPAPEPPPLPAEPLPLVSVKRSRPPPLPTRPVKPVPLKRAENSQVDEVRFEDAPDSSIEVLLVDFIRAENAVKVDTPEYDDDGPPTVDVPAQTGMPTDELELDTFGTMATMRLFAPLTGDALVALADAAELVEFVPGAMIIVRDERAFALYAIVSGMARVTVAGGGDEIRLQEGDIFGEGSLLDEGKRQADVRAETPLMTLRIEKRALDELTKAHPEVEDALFDLLARRLITNLMQTSPLFAPFEPDVRLELAQKFEVRRAPVGTVIAERGRRSDGLYVLLAGNVMAEPDGAAPTRIARGTAFGHASLLGAGTADVTIRAASEAVLLRMPAAGFASLAALYPPALAHLAETANEPLPMSRRDG